MSAVMNGNEIAIAQSRALMLRADRLRQAGRTKREISEKLGLSVWTITAYFRRLGIERGEIAQKDALPERRCLGRCGKTFRPPHKGRFMCDTCARSASGAVYGW